MKNENRSRHRDRSGRTGGRSVYRYDVTNLVGLGTRAIAGVRNAAGWVFTDEQQLRWRRNDRRRFHAEL